MAVAIPPIRPVAERKVAAHFLAAGAVSMADAVTFVPTNLSRQRAFERLKGADVVKTNGKGGWYLDEAVWSERRSNRRTRVVFAMLAVAAAGAFAALR